MGHLSTDSSLVLIARDISVGKVLSDSGKGNALNLNILPSHFELVSTQDGSPSMKIIYPEATEWMHSSFGAWSESLYIYLQAIEKAHKCQLPFSILSVGLGLGYNEIISTAYALKHQLPVKISYFESESFLSQSFQSWCLGQLSQQSPMFFTYHQILERCGRYFDISPALIVQALEQSVVENQLLDLGPLHQIPQSSEKFSIVYFDPFSSKATPHFWTETFISDFINTYCFDHCIWSTYAATGALKRQLKAFGFDVDLRPGFAAKRNSIFAVRL